MKDPTNNRYGLILVDIERTAYPAKECWSTLWPDQRPCPRVYYASSTQCNCLIDR